MNWFMIGAFLLYIGATIYECVYGSFKLGGVYLCYAISALLLAFMRE